MYVDKQFRASGDWALASDGLQWVSAAPLQSQSRSAGVSSSPMWRIKWPDGHLSDMVNLSRAKDAAVAIAERGPPARYRRMFNWKQDYSKTAAQAGAGAFGGAGLPGQPPAQNNAPVSRRRPPAPPLPTRPAGGIVPGHHR